MKNLVTTLQVNFMKIYLLIEEDDILEEIKDGRGAKQGDREFIIKKSSANSYEFPNFFEA
jgi:hypothetical protein